KLGRSSEFGVNPGLDSDTHGDKRHSSHFVNALGSGAASGVASGAPILPTYQENSTHRDSAVGKSFGSYANSSHGLNSAFYTNTLGAGGVAVGSHLSNLADRDDRSEHYSSHSTQPQRGVKVPDVDNRDLNTTGLNNEKIHHIFLECDNTLRDSSRIDSKDALSGEHSLANRSPSGNLETNNHLSHRDLSGRSQNKHGLSDTTNNTPIHRDDSTDAETGTTSALGSMLLGKIKQAAGSILGNEQLKSEGQATHGQARENLHEA
ncbi:hypothetical protein K7432_016720, partial [Basidiobolus ranarum]